MYTKISTFSIFTIVIISSVLITINLFSVAVLAVKSGGGLTSGKNAGSGTSDNRLSYNGSPMEDSKKLSDCESKAAKDGSLTKHEVQDCYNQINAERIQAANTILNSVGQLFSPK